MIEIDVDISIAAGDWRRIGDAETVVGEAARAAARAALAEWAGGAGGRGFEVSVTLGDDSLIRDLNRSYRGIDKATNVLSFPQARPGGGGDVPGLAHLLGDIVLAHETIEREAAAAGRLVAQHLAHLVVHGMLHLFGYDHEEDAQAAQMEEMETRILAGIGVPDPYGPAKRESEDSGGGPGPQVAAGQDQ